MLIISKKILDDILAHSKETYPEECCGILVGRDEAGKRVVTESYRARNVSEGRKHDRYLIDEKKLIEVMKATRGLSVDVVGFYHSHPDYPSRPSGYDTETAAWPGYSYMIVSVAKEKVVSFQSWVMPDGANAFEEEPIDAAAQHDRNQEINIGRDESRPYGNS
ncbi:M67 family metallopeptidase [Candidatus Poribacteria bacterium]|nr:M67 family metallopeptidase [Candidatus Poribacteria bacterium]